MALASVRPPSPAPTISISISNSPVCHRSIVLRASIAIALRCSTIRQLLYSHMFAHLCPPAATIISAGVSNWNLNHGRLGLSLWLSALAAADERFGHECYGH